MKPPRVTLQEIRQLGEPCLSATIPQPWADDNGHMNMRYYVALFDDAGDELHRRMGLSVAYHRERGTGTMDLEHHTHFLNEVMPGAAVSIYVRAVEANAKRLHYLMFLVNESTGQLSSIFECMNAFVDLRVRKMAPWPEEIRALTEAMVAEHSALLWAAPVSGAMKV